MAKVFSLSSSRPVATILLACLAASCAVRLDAEDATHAASALTPVLSVVYVHQGIAAGPVLFTREDGSVFDERRYEPFGTPLDSRHEDSAMAVSGSGIDFRRESKNVLNKETDPATGLSDHGARWDDPGLARWLSPDPLMLAPTPAMVERPWAMNSYEYVMQDPVGAWDPDGWDSAKIERDRESSEKERENEIMPRFHAVVSWLAPPREAGSPERAGRAVLTGVLALPLVIVAGSEAACAELDHTLAMWTGGRVETSTFDLFFALPGVPVSSTPRVSMLAAAPSGPEADTAMDKVNEHLQLPSHEAAKPHVPGRHSTVHPPRKPPVAPTPESTPHPPSSSRDPDRGGRCPGGVDC